MELVDGIVSSELASLRFLLTHPFLHQHKLTRSCRWKLGIAMQKKHISVRVVQSPLKVSIADTSAVLNLLFVDDEYQRKGAGRLMVEWGNRLADTMMLPLWVEASKQGRGLYASCGYEVVEHVYLESKHNTWEGGIDYPLMRRPVMVLVQ